MPESLVQMLDMQQMLQQVSRDGDPTTVQNNRHRIQLVRDQFEAMIDEMVEAKKECGWKPWGTSEHFNAEPMLRELIDVWHFFNNWLLTIRPLMGFDNNQDFVNWLLEAYTAKHIVNMERLTSGKYDGFAEKCPQCQREKEAADWEQEELKDAGGTKIRIEHFLVCPCGNIFEHKSTDEKGHPIG